jgi:hypothetical protein
LQGEVADLQKQADEKKELAESLKGTKQVHCALLHQVLRTRKEALDTAFIIRYQRLLPTCFT